MKSSELWSSLSKELFAHVDAAFLRDFRRPGGPNSRLAAWDPFDKTMRYFKFMLFEAAKRRDHRFFECYRALGDVSIGAPVSVSVNGCSIDLDYLLAVDEFLFVESALPVGEIRSVVEVGGGFGRTAHAFLKLLPGLQSYTIVDLPEMLALSRAVIEQVVPEAAGKVHFISAMDADGWRGVTADLAINIDSFQEMPPETVRSYLTGLFQNCGAAYIKNPVGKYAPESIGLKVEDPAKLHDVFRLGLATEIVDIFSEDSLQSARDAYCLAYRPAPDWSVAARKPMDIFAYYEHVVYRRRNAKGPAGMSGEKNSDAGRIRGIAG